MTNETVPSSPQKQKALTIHAELTAVLNQRPGGWADEEALQSVRHLRFRFPCASGGYMAEKINSIESWAAILYSDRKHATWGVNGVERVRSFIWEAMSSLRHIINRME
jgi:hypothetical protein